MIWSLLYVIAVLWCAAGLIWRVWSWMRTPAPWPLALSPAPSSRLGVLGRLMLETLLFRSLARASLATWLPAMAFHYGLLLVLLLHLQFVLVELPWWLSALWRTGALGVLALVGGLLVLLLRRCVVARVRYVSTPADYLYLVLLLGIATSGALMKRVWPVDLYAVGEFVRGMARFDWQSLPNDLLLAAHLALVWLLLMVMPIGKLVHGPGVWASPSFHERDANAQHSRDV